MTAFNKIREFQARMIILLENSNLSYNMLDRIDSLLNFLHKFEKGQSK